ncbi:hypothetical protein FOZ63_013884, partial [Perkinsus olseni]
MDFKKSLPADYIVPTEESISDGEDAVGDKSSPSASTTNGSASTTPASSSNSAADLQREVSAKLASDPEMVKKMQDMMKDMTPEEMDELRRVQMTGGAPADSAAARKFAEKLRNQDPNLVQKMKDMVDSLPQDQVDELRKVAASGTGAAPATGSGAAPQVPPAAGSAGLAEASRMMQENPDVMNQ